jgi:hypothetical protein
MSAINLRSSTLRLFKSNSDISLVCNCHDGELEKLRLGTVFNRNGDLKGTCGDLRLCLENRQAADDSVVEVAILVDYTVDKMLKRAWEWSYTITWKGDG